MMSSYRSFGGVVGPVESSRAAAARPQQKKPRYETTSSSSSVDGLILGINNVLMIDRELEDENNSYSVAVGEEERALENPEEQRIREAVLVRQRRPPHFPTLVRQHKAEWAGLRRRHRYEAELLVRAGGPLLVEAELLGRRHQDEEKELRARHAGELLAKRQQSIRDAEFAIRGRHEAQERERPVNRDPVVSKTRVRASRDQDKEEMCTICLDDLFEELGNGGGIRTLDCRHKYHKSCINKWLNNKNVCPLCKRKAIS